MIIAANTRGTPVAPTAMPTVQSGLATIRSLRTGVINYRRTVALSKITGLYRMGSIDASTAETLTRAAYARLLYDLARV